MGTMAENVRALFYSNCDQPDLSSTPALVMLLCP